MQKRALMWLAGAFSCLFSASACREAPDWTAFPAEEWQTLTPEEAGIRDVEAWNKWVDETRRHTRGASFKGEDHSGDKWGVAIARGGYLIQTFGNPDYKYQTASLGKAFTMACLQLAIDKGLLKSGDDLIRDHWTGKNGLNARHKYMTEGLHVSLTFNHLKDHTGGFPVTNGWSWQSCRNYEQVVPKWAQCTKDPDHDNYAHARPGTAGRHYSSGGYWRLAQALTAVWQKDLKQVIDEELFDHMGIPPGRWDWPPGKAVRETEDFYPEMPGYGSFLDPPYTIDGHVVRGGQWVVVGAKDLARFGLLVAASGVWKGKRLISHVQGHAGANGSHAGAVGGKLMGSWGAVASTFVPDEIPWHLFSRPPGYEP